MAEESRCGGNTVAICVRTLSGESTIVQVPSDGTIHDLKVALKSSFAPASSSSNFNLFFKGLKLSLSSRVDTTAVNSGEFLVLVPFVKKQRPQTPKPDLSEPPLTPSFSNSAYSEMIRESLHSRAENHSVGVKRKRDQDTCPVAFLKGVLESDCKDEFGEENKEKLAEVLKARNCLSSPGFGKCLMSGETSSYSCSCPDWVKLSMETFTFLNLFSSLIESLGEKLYFNRLEESLARLATSGVRVGVEDVKNLSILCPKVVKVVTDEFEAANYENAIVIGDFLETDGGQKHEKPGLKKTPLSKVFNSIKKRETSFKAALWESIKSLLLKNRCKNGVTVFLEDMLIFARESARVDDGQTGKDSFRSFRKSCHGTNSLLPLEMVEHLRNGFGSKGQIVHVEDINARKAVYVEIPDELSEITKSALKRIGINTLYSHQAESISAALSGKNVVVATMTSSGKSLCYNVPVFEKLTTDTDACALYLFPTKALAQDQFRALSDLIKGYEASINMGVYDGDTPYKDRTWLRNNGRLLITNPDMLHMSILPLHGQFRRILSNLRYIVVDEAHTYKGAFGCHTALILRRLRRLCSHVYGVNPSFIFCTATSANPREHCMELANLSELELIEKDGSPSSKKLFVLWNPSANPTTKSEESSKEKNSKGDAADNSSRDGSAWPTLHCFLSISQTLRTCFVLYVRELENHPYFNAGKGSVLTAQGTIEMEASIMDGKTKRCGAVSGLTTVVNPVSLARLVMEKTPHIYLAFNAAEAFARAHGVETAESTYFITPENIERLKQAKEFNRVQLDYTAPTPKQPEIGGDSQIGTVGCVAVDSAGNTAAATSTGGYVNKMAGRIGDSPLIGAGTYANHLCAVSATGIGEYIIRATLAREVAALMEYKGLSLTEAAAYAVEQSGPRGTCGLVAVSANGEVAMPYNTNGMFRACATEDGYTEVAIWPKN